MQPSILMCSDDSSCNSSADDHDVTLEEKLNKDIYTVQNWLQSNKPTLNGKMTKCVITGSHYRLWHLHEDLDIRVTHQQFMRATTYRLCQRHCPGWQYQKDVICTCKKAFAGKDLNTADCCNVQSP